MCRVCTHLVLYGAFFDVVIIAENYRSVIDELVIAVGMGGHGGEDVKSRRAIPQPRGIEYPIRLKIGANLAQETNNGILFEVTRN